MNSSLSNLTILQNRNKTYENSVAWMSARYGYHTSIFQDKRNAHIFNRMRLNKKKFQNEDNPCKNYFRGFRCDYCFLFSTVHGTPCEREQQPIVYFVCCFNWSTELKPSHDPTRSRNATKLRPNRNCCVVFCAQYCSKYKQSKTLLDVSTQGPLLGKLSRKVKTSRSVFVFCRQLFYHIGSEVV